MKELVKRAIRKRPSKLRKPAPRVDDDSKNSSDDSLSKFIAQAGVCSRRQAVALIKEGSVKINGVVTTEPATRVSEEAVVKVGSKVIHKAENKAYILLNKPRNYVTTVSDDEGRQTVMDLLVGAPRVRLYPVGRLDRNTSGLLIMTNDGDLAQALSHPSNEVKKIYKVLLEAPLHEGQIKAILHGIRLSDGPVRVDTLTVDPVDPRRAIIKLHSGKYRVIRRIFEYFGHTVKKLDRLNYAGLTQKDLPVGRWRFLQPKEVAILREASSKKAKKAKKSPVKEPRKAV
jgi:23S rRNA pseudouridine2605 synthase